MGEWLGDLDLVLARVADEDVREFSDIRGRVDRHDTTWSNPTFPRRVPSDPWTASNGCMAGHSKSAEASIQADSGKVLQPQSRAIVGEGTNRDLGIGSRWRSVRRFLIPPVSIRFLRIRPGPGAPS